LLKEARAVTDQTVPGATVVVTMAVGIDYGTGPPRRSVYTTSRG
jgi:hypothetical protein